MSRSEIYSLYHSPSASESEFQRLENLLLTTENKNKNHQVWCVVFVERQYTSCRLQYGISPVWNLDMVLGSSKSLDDPRSGISPRTWVVQSFGRPKFWNFLPETVKLTGTAKFYRTNAAYQSKNNANSYNFH